MVNIFRTRLDPDARDNGRWCTYLDGSRWKIASFQSPNYQEALRKAREPYEDILNAAPNSREADELQRKVVDTAMANAPIVTEWNCEDDDGPMQCTPENLLRVFSDPELTHIRVWVMEQANDTLSCTLARLDAGNSRGGSAGT